MRVNYAIVFVSDMKRSVAFYRDVVGLSMKFQSPGWTEFASEGATIALHQDGEDAGTCRPGLNVPDLAEFHQRMVATKVICVQQPKEVFGARVAQYQDPDGLVISVGESRRPTG